MQTRVIEACCFWYALWRTAACNSAGLSRPLSKLLWSPDALTRNPRPAILAVHDRSDHENARRQYHQPTCQEVSVSFPAFSSPTTGLLLDLDALRVVNRSFSLVARNVHKTCVRARLQAVRGGFSWARVLAGCLRPKPYFDWNVGRVRAELNGKARPEQGIGFPPRIGHLAHRRLPRAQRSTTVTQRKSLFPSSFVAEAAILTIGPAPGSTVHLNGGTLTIGPGGTGTIKIEPGGTLQLTSGTDPDGEGPRSP